MSGSLCVGVEKETDLWEGWHFLREDRRLWGGGNLPKRRRRRVKEGATYRVKGPPVLCKHGLHACKRALDALCYVPPIKGLIVCRVRLSGEMAEDEGKACATERTVIWMAEATRTLYEFGIWCAEKALRAARVEDKGCRMALAVKRSWLDGEATDDDLARARWAVGSLYWDSIRAAHCSAGAEPLCSARSAVWRVLHDDVADAVCGAAADARGAIMAAVGGDQDATRIAVRDEQNAELERRLWTLAPKADSRR